MCVSVEAFYGLNSQYKKNSKNKKKNAVLHGEYGLETKFKE
uniref:Uncharacterized protein n=1 Tax=Rhizophora mucronata TaxID=61149 RepID=A0A2P2L506_RHIMU